MSAIKNFCAAIGLAVLSIAYIIVTALIVGIVVMLLWNWLMPVIFGLPVITYWQGWGLTFLSGVLFKNSSTSKSDK
jgi:hypothetical protein